MKTVRLKSKRRTTKRKQTIKRRQKKCNLTKTRFKRRLYRMKGGGWAEAIPSLPLTNTRLMTGGWGGSIPNIQPL